MCSPFIRTVLPRGMPGLHGPGGVNQAKAGSRKLQENESAPLIRNRADPQQQRPDNVQREVSRVQLTPDPTLNQAVGRQHHQGAQHGNQLQQHHTPRPAGSGKTILA